MSAMEEEMRKAQEEIKLRKEEAERNKVIGASVRLVISMPETHRCDALSYSVAAVE